MSDLARIFALDPQDMTDQDLDAIIEEERKNRSRFKAAGQPSRMPKVSEAAKSVGKLDLGDLGL